MFFRHLSASRAIIEQHAALHSLLVQILFSCIDCRLRTVKATAKLQQTRAGSICMVKRHYTTVSITALCFVTA